jgi:hypothetical protein
MLPGGTSVAATTFLAVVSSYWVVFVTIFVSNPRNLAATVERYQNGALARIIFWNFYCECFSCKEFRVVFAAHLPSSISLFGLFG